MPDAPDLKALAERYLDLWEQQFSSAAADPALASAMAAWLAPWRAMGAGAMPGAGTRGDTGSKNDGPGTSAARHAGTGGKPGTAAAGAAAAGAASRDGGSGLDRILERLDRIERRLDALERQREPKPAAKPAGGRNRRTPGAG